MKKPFKGSAFRAYFKMGFICLLVSIKTLFATHSVAEESNLPVLGDHLSGIISADREHQIGQILLRQLRAQMPIIVDPLTNDYLLEVSYRLISNSELSDRRIDILIIDDPAINAFAIPGGIIAINSGLFLHAKTEDEFTAVLAHEIAHLSQRHFARMLAQQKNAQIPTMGAYLASILILATVGAEPGLGALAATHAAKQQTSLSFSRKNEQEADRIGMQTMVNSGLDPNAMAAFFWELQRSSQYAGIKPPEYLLTHPVTESRIADAKNRARKYDQVMSEDNLEFHLIRTRLRIHNEEKPENIIKNLQANAGKGRTTVQIANSYGLVLAHMETKNYKQAKKRLKPLLKNDPTRIAFLLADAEIDFAMKDYKAANKKLKKALTIHPSNYSLSMLYAETLVQQKQSDSAIYLLENISINQQNDPYIWHLLIDAYGQKGDRMNVFRAKAQYFYLYGLNEQAIAQLKFALPMAEGNYQLKSKILTKIDEIKASQTEIKL